MGGTVFIDGAAGTTGLEIAEQAATEGISKADVLVCCGGGGLTSGIALALASRATLEKSKPFAAPIVTPVEKASEFYPAESYHQDYYLKNPIRYSYYRNGCGRDRRLSSLWGDAAK